jgi:hypothetical protein
MTECETEMRVHRMSIVAICNAIATDGDVTDARMTAMQLAWAMLQSAREASGTCGPHGTRFTAKVEAA